MEIKIKSLGGQIPAWKDFTDAGLDLHASEDVVLPPGERCMIPLGIATAFSSQYVAIIKDRSGMAAKGLYTHAGVIDSSYRGEWKVIVKNSSLDIVRIAKGDRVAQVLFLPCFHLKITEVQVLPESVRGVGGFGSTGQ